MKNILTTILEKLKPTISEDNEDLQIRKSIGSKKGYDWSRSLDREVKKVMSSRAWLDFFSSKRGICSPSLQKALEERLCEVESERKKNHEPPPPSAPGCSQDAPS